MAHNDNQNISDNTGSTNEDHPNTQQRLVEAHQEIADLKMQIAWLERSYE